MSKTQNDTAWEKIFDEDSILEKISREGYFEIEASRINQVRQSRLMAKFDHYENLPKIFKDNNLSILPISRSKYVIGNFENYQAVESNSPIEFISVDFPDIESIDYANLYSESSALHCAFITGIIDDLVGEKTIYTVSGRMSTSVFSFNVRNLLNDQLYTIQVENSQCEIDGGFESDNYFLIVEAKNYAVENFVIRQLYYPYRLWRDKIRKKVIPVLMTYSNDVFSFYIYEFNEMYNYNSLRLIKQKNYMIAPEIIQLSDVSQVFSEANLVKEPTVPFPQADKFERMVDLLSLLVEKDLTRNEIAENYQFDIRQSTYYTDACRYIGLLEKYKRSGTRDVVFRLTNEGRSLLKRKHKNKYISLISKILEHQVFYNVFKLTLSKGEIPSRDEVCKVMADSNLNINSTTIERRSRTVRKWIEWIWLQIEE